MNPDSDPAADRSAAFRRAWSDFHEAIDGLQEFLESVAPHLSKLEGDDLPAAATLSPSQRDELRRVVVRLRRGLRYALEGSTEDGSATDEAGTAKATIEVVPGTSSRKTRVNLSADPDVNEAVVEFLRRMPQRRRKKMPILLRSVLTMSVSAFEVLVGQLAEARYRLHPRAMGTDKKEFSLEDLSKFDAIDDATTALIERRTDELMRRGLDGWADWHKEETSIRFQEIALDWPATQEVFERRHLAVHHGGRVSPQYHRRLGSESPPIGSVLDLDEAYVQESLDRIGVLGALLIGAAWAQLLPNDHRSAGSLLDGRVYLLMERGKWSLAQHVARVTQDRLQLAEDARYRLLFNELLCLKRTHGSEAVRKAAEDIDTSALSRPYKLARLALLDRSSDALEEARAALAAEELGINELQTWLVLEELRQWPDFRQVAGLPPIDRRPMTPADLARELGISAATLRGWLRRTRPRAPGERGRKWDLRTKDIDAARHYFSSRNEGTAG